MLIIGWYHEHSRPDRDAHVDILWENIKRVETEDHLFRLEKNYKKCNSCTTYGKYDLVSIMHYPSTLGFQNRTAIKPKEGLYSEDTILKMGQREGLSLMDAEDVNRYFECGKYFDLLLL